MQKPATNNSKLSLKKQIKILWKPFLFLFLVIFVIWNWDTIFWMFNYRIMAVKLDAAARVMHTIFVYPPVEEATAEANYLEKENWLEIPKLGIKAPLVFVENGGQNKDLEKYLDKGVLHYPQSALPGKQGKVVILGHSAPAGWPKINYDWVFTNINNLVSGDKVYILFNDQQYVYKVTKKVFLERGEEITDSNLTPLEVNDAQQNYKTGEPLTGLTDSQSMLILLSCWPPGKDHKRIAVEAILQ